MGWVVRGGLPCDLGTSSKSSPVSKTASSSIWLWSRVNSVSGECERVSPGMVWGGAPVIARDDVFFCV